MTSILRGSSLLILLAAGSPALAQVPAAPGLDLQPDQAIYRQLAELMAADGCQPLATGSPLMSQAPLSRLEAASLLSRCLASDPPVAAEGLNVLRTELAAELADLEVRVESLQGPGFVPTSRLHGQATFVIGKPRL